MQPVETEKRKNELPAGAPLLAVGAVTVAYASGKQSLVVLRDLSLAVAAGELVGLVGPNGCGKTTLIRAVTKVVKPVSGEGPSKQTTSGQQVLFEPMTRLAPKADVTYKVVGQCLAPGDLRIKVLLQTDEMAQPVTKEESTKVYKD